jgi:uncharacterized damage-inducible protein DinB
VELDEFSRHPHRFPGHYGIGGRQHGKIGRGQPGQICGQARAKANSSFVAAVRADDSPTGEAEAIESVGASAGSAFGEGRGHADNPSQFQEKGGHQIVSATPGVKCLQAALQEEEKPGGILALLGDGVDRLDHGACRHHPVEVRTEKWKSFDHGNLSDGVKVAALINNQVDVRERFQATTEPAFGLPDAFGHSPELAPVRAQEDDNPVGLTEGIGPEHDSLIRTNHASNGSDYPRPRVDLAVQQPKLPTDRGPQRYLGPMTSTPLPSYPPHSAAEFEMLTAFLDWYRIVMVRKIEGLDPEGLRRSPVGSGTTLGGLVKHLAYVERHWFGSSYGGLTLDYPYTDEDPDADFRLNDDDTVASLTTFYQTECQRSREMVAANPNLDHVVPATRGRMVSLRWILVHMIEETARHAGHADIIREMIDGTVGD